MTAIVDVEPETGPFDGDAVAGYLVEVLAAVGGLAVGTGPVDDATRIDRIALLERVKAATAAAQAAEIVAFARSQVAAQQTARVNYRRLGQGIGKQVGLATKTSGWHGARKLTLARDLIQQLPATFDVLARGEISEYVAQLVATETSHLDPDDRRAVDAQLVAQHVEELGPKQAAGLARRLAYAADPHGAVRRARKARSERRVTLRAAPDTMCWLTALLPVEDGVACYAALTRHTDTQKASGDERTRGQIMADTATERLTGQAPADGRPVELNLTMPLEHLTDPDNHTPAEVPGYGPLPAGLADEIIGRAGNRVWWRRLFTALTSDGHGRVVVGGDPTARRFTGWLATLLKLRDGGICREPFCGAPIRHLDHITPWRDGGPTTAANGRGVCERHNHARELPGWRVETLTWGHSGQPYLIATTTPTGHTTSAAHPTPHDHQDGRLPMILRIWRGLVPTERADDYADLVRRTGIAGYRETPGNLDAQIALRDIGGGRSEIMTLSWWTSLDDIRAFAGADVDRAKYYPEDDAYLLDRDLKARHFEATR